MFERYVPDHPESHARLITERLRSGLQRVRPDVLVIIAAGVLTIPRVLDRAGGLVGGYHDDGVYAVTARALAVDGRYEISSLPEPVVQTKYPPLFSAALAAVWKLVPSFPENVAALRLVPWLCMWAWLYVVWIIVAVELGRREAATWIVLLTLAAPMTLYFGTQLMAETMFAFLGSCAVLLMVRIDSADEPPATQQLALLTIVCALAFHTRTIAITLLPAVAYVLLRRRNYRHLVWFMVGFSALAVPWIAWQAVHAPPADPMLAYYTKANYSMWNLLTGGQDSAAAVVVSGNLVNVLALPAEFWAVTGSMITAVVSSVVVVLLLAFALAALGSRAAAVSVWFLATLAITLFWLWLPARFLLPVLPLAIVLMVLPFQRAGVAAVWLGRGVAAVLLLSAWTYAAGRRGGEGTSNYIYDARTEADLTASLSWIRTQTPAEAVIAGTLDPMYWLYTGRKSVRSFSADPYTLFFDPSSGQNPLGRPQDLASLLERHRVTHLVVEHIPLFSESRPLRRQVEMLKECSPGLLTPVWRSPNGIVAIYAVRISRNALATLDLGHC